MSKVYIIGSLRSSRPHLVATFLRAFFMEHAGPHVEVFDDWQAAGPIADDSWRDYEKQKGNGFLEALSGYAAQHVFAFDKKHLDSADAAILVLPAGKSGHLELGYMIGKGKPCVILLEQADPERWDVMYQFAGLVTSDVQAAGDYIIRQLGLDIPF